MTVNFRPADMPIPARLNVGITAAVVVTAVSLLWLGSWVEAWYAVLAVGVVFSYVLLTNYALFHEASHGSLHSHPAINRLLGTITGFLFPMPFSMFRVTHQGHHLRNRTTQLWRFASAAKSFALGCRLLIRIPGLDYRNAAEKHRELHA